MTYLALANLLVHEIAPNGFTIAEDVSGMAGLAAPFRSGGVGFDFRMSMGCLTLLLKHEPRFARAIAPKTRNK